MIVSHASFCYRDRCEPQMKAGLRKVARRERGEKKRERTREEGVRF